MPQKLTDRRGFVSSRVPGRIRHMASPDSGRVGQGARFILSGATVALIYLGFTTLLFDGAGLPFEVALACGFACGIVANFSLQRLFVWVDHSDYALPLRGQVARYAILVAVQYGTTALVTAVLPHALHVSPTAVFIPWTLLVSALNFVLLGSRIFHTDRPAGIGAT
jgi:putative flippase GtrA